MLTTKNWYAIGMTRRTGKRTTSQEKNGLSASVAASVPANIHGSLPTPDAAATASRIGRNTKYALSKKKKNANDVSTARTSTARMSTARRTIEWSRELPVILSDEKDLLSPS